MWPPLRGREIADKKMGPLFLAGPEASSMFRGLRSAVRGAASVATAATA
jgi:hypothetical protein